MDMYAITFAQKVGLPYLLPNELISGKDIRDSLNAASAATTVWARSLSVEALNWTENWAYYGSNGFFQYCCYPVYVATALARNFQKNGTRLITFLRNPPLFYDLGRSSDIGAYLWTQILGDSTLTMRYTAPCYQPVLPQRQQQDWSCLQDAVVFSFNEGCLARQWPLMEPTHKECGYPVVWMPYYFGLMPKTAALQALDKGNMAYKSIPVRALPVPSEKNASMPADAGKLLQKAADGIIPHAAQLGAIFEEHANFYARLEAQLKMLCAIWSKFRPRLVVAENIAQPEYAVPLLAAKQLGIPSIAVPHGALHVPARCSPPLPATRYAFASAFTEDAFAESNAVSADVIGSFDAVAMENEHPVQHHENLLPRDEKINILVLTGPPVSLTPLHMFITDAEHTQALRQLYTIPPDLEGKARVMFKTHPGTLEFWDYYRAGIGQEQILPKNSILAEALVTTDIVVALDYVGSPHCQAMRADIPVITCIASDHLRNATQYTRIVMEAGLVAEGVEAVWGYARRLLTDLSFRNDCLARQRTFHEARLHPRRNDWIAWLQETITNDAYIKASL
ncbi:MAG: hypothetical protein LBV80_00950 [Deltaproteobacteria bacterium]|nr:hypothetical protein [Deltaproteobacteria bacterium]